MDNIKIGDKIRFSTAGKYNPGYSTGETYVGVVVGKPFRDDWLHVKVDGMPLASISEDHVEEVMGHGDVGSGYTIPNPVAMEVYEMMDKYAWTNGGWHKSVTGNIVYEAHVMPWKAAPENIMELLRLAGFDVRYRDSYSWWAINKDMMSEVSYCEGDISIVVHECMEDMEESIMVGDNFYKNEKG